MAWSDGDDRLAVIQLRRELLASGHTDKSIRQLVATGVLHRVRHGAYAERSRWVAADEDGRHALRARAVLKQARTEVALSHLSAAREWEIPLWDLTDDDVHIARTDERGGRRQAGVVQHYGALRDGDLEVRRGVPVTSATRTVIDCLTIVDNEHGLTMVNNVLNRGLTTIEDLAATRTFIERWPNTLSARIPLQLAEPRCGASVGEGRTLFLMWKHGLPKPIPQFPVKDESGQVIAYVDFAWPERGVFLEFDGRIKYEHLRREGETAADAVVREKKREDLIRRLTGWRCIRITWADLYKPEITAELIRAALFPSGLVTS